MRAMLNDKVFNTEEYLEQQEQIIKENNNLQETLQEKNERLEKDNQKLLTEINDIDDEILLGFIVSGGGDGYFDVGYELQPDGWRIVHADLYEEENEDW